MSLVSIIFFWKISFCFLFVSSFQNTMIHLFHSLWCHSYLLITFGYVFGSRSTCSHLTYDVFSDARGTSRTTRTRQTRGCVTYSVCKKISAFVRSDSSLSALSCGSFPRRRSRSRRDACLPFPRLRAFWWWDDDVYHSSASCWPCARNKFKQWHYKMKLIFLFEKTMKFNLP